MSLSNDTNFVLFLILIRMKACFAKKKNNIVQKQQAQQWNENDYGTFDLYQDLSDYRKG